MGEIRCLILNTLDLWIHILFAPLNLTWRFKPYNPGGRFVVEYGYRGDGSLSGVARYDFSVDESVWAPRFFLNMEIQLGRSSRCKPSSM